MEGSRYSHLLPLGLAARQGYHEATKATVSSSDVEKSGLRRGGLGERLLDEGRSLHPPPFENDMQWTCCRT